MYHAADVFAERGAGAEVEGWDSRNLTHDYCLHQGAEVHVSHNTKHGGAEQPNPTRRPLTSLNAAHRIQMQRQKMTPRPRPRPPAPAITPQNERQGFPICGLKTAATTVDIGYKVIGQCIYT